MKPRIVPGAEPFAFDGGSTGVLLLHGFTGNPASLRPMGESLAARGHTVIGPRYPGHGTTWRELAETRWQEWVAEAEAGLVAIAGRCEHVVVAGLSMGGAMALHLAAAHPEELVGVVAINPYVRDRRHAALPVARLFMRTTRGVGNDIKKPGQDELPYDRVPLTAAAEVARFLKVVREDLPRVTLPLLLFHSPEDHVVPQGTAEYVFGAVGSEEKELVPLLDSYHVATLDHDAETIVRRTHEFLLAHASGEGTPPS